MSMRKMRLQNVHPVFYELSISFRLKWKFSGSKQNYIILARQREAVLSYALQKHLHSHALI